MKLFRSQARYVPPPVNDDSATSILPFRNIPHAYEVNALGRAESTNPPASWSRGALVRATDPTFDIRMPPPVPMYDPTTMGPPEYWRP